VKGQGRRVERTKVKGTTVKAATVKGTSFSSYIEIHILLWALAPEGKARDATYLSEHSTTASSSRRTAS
jgi:hypothetical protein